MKSRLGAWDWWGLAGVAVASILMGLSHDFTTHSRPIPPPLFGATCIAIAVALVLMAINCSRTRDEADRTG
jgi:hypothetical protein